MKIIDAKLQVVEVPLPHPFPSTWNPGNPETKLFVTIAEIITDDGIHGYGAACDSSQLLAGIWDTHIRPLVIGKEITQVEAINTGLVNASLYAYRPWCVEVAVWDALGKYANLPIYKMLGGVQDKVLAYASTGSLKSVEERVEDAERFIAEGFKMMKLRAHHDDPFEDVRIIAEIKKRVGDKLKIAVDANQGWFFTGKRAVAKWDLKKALNVCRAFEEIGIEWIEEPLYGYDFEGLAELRKRTTLHVAGGVLMYGIPEFRLPKAIVQQEIDGLKKMGVDFECNMVIGKVLTIDELMGEYGYEAVFVGSGAGLPRFMGIPGESLKGVYSANEFLTRSNLMKAYLPASKTPIRTGRKVAVVGGGNVAMDAARSALRLGAETVYIVYRRGMAELPARKEEVEHAEEEGIIFKTLCNPVEILPDENGFVKAITCIEMELGEPDASGRCRPIEKKGSEFTMDVDTVIMSLGTSPNPLIRSTTPGLETNKHGCIVTEGDEGKTSREGVYAGGDAVTGAATVIKAMGAGKAAAKAIDEYIQNK